MLSPPAGSSRKGLVWRSTGTSSSNDKARSIACGSPTERGSTSLLGHERRWWMVPPRDDHDCGWKAHAEYQSSQTPEQARERRNDDQLLRDSKLETKVTHSAVCSCDECGSTSLTLLTEKPSVVYEYVQSHFRSSFTAAAAFARTATAPQLRAPIVSARSAATRSSVTPSTWSSSVPPPPSRTALDAQPSTDGGLLCWAGQQRRLHDPRSAMGKAARNLARNSRELGCCLRFASIEPDNNKAEGAPRRVAKGRSSFLFVGSERAGHNPAVVYTLVASCEQHYVDPIAYLTDVLIRVQRDPASKVRDLLPHSWKPSTVRNRS